MLAGRDRLLIFDNAKKRSWDKGHMRPKGTKQPLEIRRRVAMALLQDGWGVRKVARQVQASPSSIFGWRIANLFRFRIQAYHPNTLKVTRDFSLARVRFLL
jgi:hypothetical protein